MTMTNEVVVTGYFNTEAVTATFTKQILKVSTKNREGQQAWGELDIYIKPDLISQYNITNGALIKIKGFIVFNFAPNGKTFPKVLVTEIKEIEYPGQGAQGGGQPAQVAAPATQPQMQAPQPQAPAQPAAPTMPTPPGMEPAPAAPQAQAPVQPAAPEMPQAPTMPTPPGV